MQKIVIHGGRRLRGSRHGERLEERRSAAPLRLAADARALHHPRPATRRRHHDDAPAARGAGRDRRRRRVRDHRRPGARCSPRARRRTTWCRRCGRRSSRSARSSRAPAGRASRRPGGCAIGSRPVDIHLAGLERLGAAHPAVATATSRPRLRVCAARRITLDFPSVGATENLHDGRHAGRRHDRDRERRARARDRGPRRGAHRDGRPDRAGPGRRSITIEGVRELGGFDHTVDLPTASRPARC